jgi:hypothetical protein
MATSIDKVLQPDGSYKWELVDSWDPMSERKHQQAAVKAAKPAKKAKAKKVAEPAEEPVNLEPQTESAPEA